jgi:hypothetical protein
MIIYQANGRHDLHDLFYLMQLASSRWILLVAASPRSPGSTRLLRSKLIFRPSVSIARARRERRMMMLTRFPRVLTSDSEDDHELYHHRDHRDYSLYRAVVVVSVVGYR